MKSRKQISIIITTILFSIVVMISCTHKNQDSIVPDISFSEDILPIFKSSCAINSSCHVGAYNLNDHIDLTDSMAYSTIVSRRLVNTGNPAVSLLYNEIVTGAMPQTPYSKLSAAQISLILNWIKQGAQNN